MPRACSWLPRLTSSTSVFTFAVLSVIAPITPATRCSRVVPFLDFAMDPSISATVSLAVRAERRARLRTSSACAGRLDGGVQGMRSRR